jgi:hypothetical protein
MILPAVKKGKGPIEGQFRRALLQEKEYPALGGGRISWRRMVFSPSGMLRNIRETYDFGDTFLCPGGETWGITALEADAAGPVELELLFGGSATVWVNDAECEWKSGPFKVILQKGANLVIVKIIDLKWKDHGFALNVTFHQMELRFRSPKFDTDEDGVLVV